MLRTAVAAIPNIATSQAVRNRKRRRADRGAGIPACDPDCVIHRNSSAKSRADCQRFSGSCFYGIYMPDKEFRYAVLVGKKHGNSPERNRIKRQFREAVRLGGRQTIGTGKVLILPRKDCKSIGFEPIKESLCRALNGVRKSQAKSSE